MAVDLSRFPVAESKRPSIRSPAIDVYPSEQLTKQHGVMKKKTRRRWTAMLDDFNRAEVVLWSKSSQSSRQQTMLLDIFTTKMTISTCAAGHFGWPNSAMRPRDILLGDDLKERDAVEKVLVTMIPI